MYAVMVVCLCWGEDFLFLVQELVRVQKLLEVRETRMVEMSREMIQLTEANQELQWWA